MMLDANRFDRVNPVTGKTDPKGTEWVAEIAELGLKVVYSQFLLQNCPEPGMHRTFGFKKVDDSGGDVAGWRYEEANGPNKGRHYRNGGTGTACKPLTVLIIND